MDDQGSGQDIDGALMAADFAQGAGEFETGFQILAVLEVFLGPEIGAGQRIGAVVGGVIGNEVARRGDKTVGTIIGAAVGAVAGRAIDKSNDPCRR